MSQVDKGYLEDAVDATDLDLLLIGRRVIVGKEIHLSPYLNAMQVAPPGQVKKEHGQMRLVTKVTL